MCCRGISELWSVVGGLWAVGCGLWAVTNGDRRESPVENPAWTACGSPRERGHLSETSLMFANQ
jgi:hypothetical protein